LIVSSSSGSSSSICLPFFVLGFFVSFFSDSIICSFCVICFFWIGFLFPVASSYCSDSSSLFSYSSFPLFIFDGFFPVSLSLSLDISFCDTFLYIFGFCFEVLSSSLGTCSVPF